ncbi:MAG: hypothetical protein P8045_13765 [Candidatus Thiodiazotropha sp.]
MVERAMLSHRQLMKELVKHCKARASGTVFYNLESGESARMVLSHGEICWVAYQDLRGEAAIEAIAKIVCARFSFNSLLKLAIGEQQLPSTPTILKRLNSNGDSQEVKQDVPIVTDVVSSTDPVEGSGENRPFEQIQVRMTLESEAMEYLGPMARILCADYMKAMPSHLNHGEVRQLISTLVQDIGDERKGQQFIGRVKKSLNIV